LGFDKYVASENSAFILNPIYLHVLAERDQVSELPFSMKRKLRLLLLTPILVLAFVGCFPVKDCFLNIDSNTVILTDSAYIKSIVVVETNENRSDRTTVLDTTLSSPQTEVILPLNRYSGKNIEIFVETNKTGNEYFLRICSNCWNKKERLYFHRIYR